MPVSCDDWGIDKCVDGGVGSDGATGANVDWKAFDDVEATFWDSTIGFPHFIGYRFWTPQQVQKLRIKQYTSEYCQNFIIQGSNDLDFDYDWDLKNWTNLLTVSDGQSSGWQEWTFENAISYLHIRLRATSGTGSAQYWGIYEIEFYVCPPVFPQLSGTVKEKGSPVIRVLRSYIRSTGILFDSTQSIGNGTYSLDAPDTDTEMFVIAFDDAPGSVYNDLIYGRVKAES